eukprot:m.289944 g.289944  ORF g.289944 m.289944 type:complete len:97 (+) comp15812_c1_seq5:1303-1593(+)
MQISLDCTWMSVEAMHKEVVEVEVGGKEWVEVGHFAKSTVLLLEETKAILSKSKQRCYIHDERLCSVQRQTFQAVRASDEERHRTVSTTKVSSASR